MEQALEICQKILLGAEAKRLPDEQKILLLEAMREMRIIRDSQSHYFSN